MHLIQSGRIAAEFSVRRVLLTILVLATACRAGLAQSACKYGSDQAFDGLVNQLKNEKTCQSAVATLHACEWGSSADTEFAPIVITKCEKTFFNGLSAAGKKRYADEMQLCAYEYAKADGTLAMSEAAMCQVDVAGEFAANPALANQPERRASFDCNAAQSLLEKAICSDAALGRADIVLSQVYKGALHSPDGTEQDRQALIQNEKDWQSAVPAACHLAEPFSTVSLNCVRSAFEDRFTALDCDGPMSDCLESLKETAPVTHASPRASFDCEKPSTALEIVICADADLGQTDIRLAEVYHDADAVMGAGQHQNLVGSQRGWLKFVNQSCPLGAVGGIPSLLTRSCVRTAFETRIVQLQSCSRKPAKEQMPCLSQFALMQPEK